MPDPITVNDVVFVPAAAQSVAASRSGGPGGQNVNKVSSKIDLRVDLTQIVGLDAGARTRLRVLCGRKLDADGHLQVISQVHRDQPRNLEDAREKVRALILAAMIVPIRRKATKPKRSAVERRLKDKKRAGATKSGRQGRDGHKDHD